MAKEPTTAPFAAAPASASTPPTKPAAPSPKQEENITKRIREELIDDYDEELEMEREDWEHLEPGAPAPLEPGVRQVAGDKIARSPVQFADAPVLRKPSWIRVRIPSGNSVAKLKEKLRGALDPRGLGR